MLIYSYYVFDANHAGTGAISNEYNKFDLEMKLGIF